MMKYMTQTFKLLRTYWKGAPIFLVIKALINERMITLVQNNAACRSNSCIYIWFVTGVFFLVFTG